MGLNGTEEGGGDAGREELASYSYKHTITLHSKTIIYLKRCRNDDEYLFWWLALRDLVDPLLKDKDCYFAVVVVEIQQHPVGNISIMPESKIFVTILSMK